MNATINGLWGKYKMEIFAFGFGVLFGVAAVLLAAHAFGSANDAALKEQSDKYLADYNASKKLVVERDKTIGSLQSEVDRLGKQVDSLKAVADKLGLDNQQLNVANTKLEASLEKLRSAYSAASGTIESGINDLKSITGANGQLKDVIEEAASLLGKANEGLRQLQRNGTAHN